MSDDFYLFVCLSGVFFGGGGGQVLLILKTDFLQLLHQNYAKECPFMYPPMQVFNFI